MTTHKFRTDVCRVGTLFPLCCALEVHVIKVVVSEFKFTLQKGKKGVRYKTKLPVEQYGAGG